jgi:nitrogen fixation/metabolism regulation signal transduction histidine kinase
MSDASSSVQPPPASEARARYQRSAKNYLLDPHFQLKYTGFLVGIATALSVVLGVVLWTTNSEVLRQSHQAVEQGKLTVVQSQETLRRHQQAIEQSQIASDIVKMNIAKEYKDYPELAKIFSEDSEGKEAKLKDEQERLKRDAASLEQRSRELERQALEVTGQQRTLLQVLVAMLSLLVIGVGVGGIVVTHRVAGPIFKMKRLLRQVGEGKLIVRERLRKGDELQHFFEAFEKMVDDLRTRQEAEIARVDEAIEQLEKTRGAQRGAGEADEEGLAVLRKLRSELREQIEA